MNQIRWRPFAKGDYTLGAWLKEVFVWTIGIVIVAAILGALAGNVKLFFIVFWSLFMTLMILNVMEYPNQHRLIKDDVLCQEHQTPSSSFYTHQKDLDFLNSMGLAYQEPTSISVYAKYAAIRQSLHKAGYADIRHPIDVLRARPNETLVFDDDVPYSLRAAEIMSRYDHIGYVQHQIDRYYNRPHESNLLFEPKYAQEAREAEYERLKREKEILEGKTS